MQKQPIIAYTNDEGKTQIFFWVAESRTLNDHKGVVDGDMWESHYINDHFKDIKAAYDLNPDYKYICEVGASSTIPKIILHCAECEAPIMYLDYLCEGCRNEI